MDSQIYNFNRFDSAKKAVEEFEAEKAIIHHAWSAVEWIYSKWSPDRLTYLRNLEECHMGTAAMYKEIKKLEKEQQ